MLPCLCLCSFSPPSWSLPMRPWHNEAKLAKVWDLYLCLCPSLSWSLQFFYGPICSLDLFGFIVFSDSRRRKRRKAKSAFQKVSLSSSWRRQLWPLSVLFSEQRSHVSPRSFFRPTHNATCHCFFALLSDFYLMLLLLSPWLVLLPIKSLSLVLSLCRFHWSFRRFSSHLLFCFRIFSCIVFYSESLT